MQIRLSILLFVLFSFFFHFGYSQNDSSMSILFIGDVMGHDSQIESAYDPASDSYDYESVFKPLKPLFNNADFSIANLEVTLAGKPHKGYPQFSSPDELAIGLKNNGVKVLVTANNHSCDRSDQGIIRTVNILDSLDIMHTGTFRNQADRDSLNLMILEKNGIRVGILNYTYGTNGLPAPHPTIVNKIDLVQMKTDLIRCRMENLDKIIVFMHWGLEYQKSPNKSQTDLMTFLFKEGVDIIIGSHPHVLQKMEYFKDTSDNQEHIVVYSLGNFVSNQRKRGTDGGAIVEIVLKKGNNKTKIAKKGYHLTWVDKDFRDGKVRFKVYSVKDLENREFEGISNPAAYKMKTFAKDSRAFLGDENKDFPELEYLSK